jgi:hypothetical protein
MDEVNIVIREFDKEKDEAFIYSSWRNSAYYLCEKARQEPAPQFFRRLTDIIKSILKVAKVRIACFQESPEVIVGYAISTGTHLNWIYVKEDFRERGIATLLFPDSTETVTDHLTKQGNKIVEKKNLKTKENPL